MTPLMRLTPLTVTLLMHADDSTDTTPDDCCDEPKTKKKKVRSVNDIWRQQKRRKGFTFTDRRRIRIGLPDTVVDETEELWRKDTRPVMDSFKKERDALEKKVDALLVQIEELNKKKRDYKSNARTVAEKKPVESEELI